MADSSWSMSGILTSLFSMAGMAGVGADVTLNQGGFTKGVIQSATGIDIGKLQEGQFVAAFKDANPITAALGVGGLLKTAQADWSTALYAAAITGALVLAARFGLQMAFNNAATEDVQAAPNPLHGPAANIGMPAPH